ncbi:probable plastid-lipid-associated protein 8, chloroplastic [Ricinus communis]|uniref:probable plastid-lipid-associated protein 8, chloroplastic n=1 Tax=Ricinus communis TaxID=3988 RepID=UPI00201ABFEB|nr:probable plastid-lipid-associated protein 8, chloroplastic [Ricinus communis]
MPIKITYVVPYLDFHANVAQLKRSVPDKQKQLLQFQLSNREIVAIISCNLTISTEAAASMAASSSIALFSSIRGREPYDPKALISRPKPVILANHAPLPARRYYYCSQKKSPRILCSVSISSSEVRTGRPDDLVASIISKVTQTDGGVTLTKEEHEEVSEVAQQLQSYCVAEPVKCPLIFGEWDVVYCSRPTSPGGGYRSAFGRLFFKTKEMIQAVEAPDTVRNKVSFSLFGFLNGEVSLKGQLRVLDESWIQVIFEAPQLKVGALELQYGGQSEVKLQITYIDDKIRLGKGSRGSLFVFQRRI